MVAELAAGLVPGLATGATRASPTTGHEGGQRQAERAEAPRMGWCSTRRSPWGRGRVDRPILSRARGAKNLHCPSLRRQFAGVA